MDVTSHNPREIGIFKQYNVSLMNSHFFMIADQ